MPASHISLRPWQPAAGDLEDALFSAVREHAELMISWARSPEALALEHDGLEDRTMTDGLELMRLVAQAHLALRAAREQRRGDVTGADGGVRGRGGRAGAHEGDDHRAGDHVPDRLPQAREGEPVPAGRGAELGGRPFLFGRGGEAGGPCRGDRPGQCHSFHNRSTHWGAKRVPTLAELGAGERIRTAGLPFTRSTAPRTVRASCTMAQAMASAALIALGLPGAPFHEPFHAEYKRRSMNVTERSNRNSPLRRRNPQPDDMSKTEQHSWPVRCARPLTFVFFALECPDGGYRV